jgi:hypothetical protein
MKAKKTFKHENGNILKILFILGVVISLAVFNSCTTKIIGKGPLTDPDEVKKESGLVYYVGKDIMKVDVKVSNITTRWVADTLEIKSKTEVEYDARATLQTIPDFENSYILGLKHKPLGTSEDQFKIDIQGIGLLKSFSATSTGQGGEILKNIVRTGAVIAGAIAPPAIPFSIATALPPPLPVMYPIIEVKTCPKKVKIQKPCYETIPGFNNLPVIDRALIKTDTTACDEWKTMAAKSEKFDKAIEKKHQDHCEVEKGIINADNSKLKEIQGQIALLNDSIKNLQEQKSIAKNRFQTFLNKFTADNKLGKQVNTADFTANFELCDIPPSSLVKTVSANIEMIKNEIKDNKIAKAWEKFLNKDLSIFLSKEQVDPCVGFTALETLKTKIQAIPDDDKYKTIKEKIVSFIEKWKKQFEAWQKQDSVNEAELEKFVVEAKEITSNIWGKNVEIYKEKVATSIEQSLKEKEYNEMAAFFKSTGVMVTLEDKSNLKDRLKNRAECIKPDPPGKNGKGSSIYYRQSIPMLLCFYGIDAGYKKLENLSQELVHVLHPKMPAYHFTFKANAFAKRHLALVFDEKGRPITVERSGTSSLKELSGALAESAVIARDEYVNTLEKMVKAQEFKRELKFDEINTKIEQIKKEKELLEAQQALEGTSSNYELLLEKQRLDMELQILKLQLSIEEAKETQEQTLEIARLKLQLEKLQNELEILKAQLAIKKLKK